MFGGPLADLEILGCRTLGCPSSQGLVQGSFCLPASSVSGAASASELLSLFHPVVGSNCCCRRFALEGCDRTRVLRTRLLQLPVCNTEGHGRLEAYHRSFLPQPLRQCLPFSYGETSLSVLQPLRPGDWIVSIDLQDAYLQVPVHSESHRYLRFCLGQQTFQFRVVCFGLSTAPQVFARVNASISSIIHRFGYRILCYLDDWLVLGSSFQDITQARDFLLWL